MDFAHIPDRIPMLLTAGELRALIDSEVSTAVHASIPAWDALREQAAMLQSDLNTVRDERDFLRTRIDEVLAEKLSLLEVPVMFEKKFNIMEDALGIDADTSDDVVNAVKDAIEERNVLRAENAGLKSEQAALQESNHAQAVALAAALRRIEELEPQPPVVVPVPEVPAPVEDMKQPDFRPGHLRFIGARIVKDDTPGNAQDANVRLNLDICQDIGVDLWGGLLNFQEVRDHQAALKAGDRVKNLVAYGEDRGIAFAADTIDAMVYDKATNVYRGDTILKPYFDGLVSLGTKFLIVNDAHQYRATNTDGTLKYPLGTLERIVGIIRRLCPLPIMGSLTINEDPSEYPMFDFLECQTFGKVVQLEGFFSKSFDVYIIPTRARESVDYHIAARPQILKRDPAAVFLFAALERGGTNFVNMHDQVIEIKKTVQQLREQQGR